MRVPTTCAPRAWPIGRPRVSSSIRPGAAVAVDAVTASSLASTASRFSRRRRIFTLL